MSVAMAAAAATTVLLPLVLLLMPLLVPLLMLLVLTVPRGEEDELGGVGRGRVAEPADVCCAP